MITPNRLGTFPVVCTELCGLGHATMRTSVRVVTPADVRGLAAGAAAGRRGGGGAAARRAGRSSPPRAAAAATRSHPQAQTRRIGPSLDDLAAAAEKAGQPLDDFVRQSIVDPDAYVVAGVSTGRDAQDLRGVALRRGDRRPRRISDREAKQLTTVTQHEPADAAHGHGPAARRAQHLRCARTCCGPHGSRPSSSGSACTSSSACAGWPAGTRSTTGRSSSSSADSSTAPIGFLLGLGAFDYWLYYISGRPTRARGPLRPRRVQLARLLPRQHRPQGDRRPVRRHDARLLRHRRAAWRCSSAPSSPQPGLQFIDSQTFNGLVSMHATLMIFLFIIPAFAGLGELRRAADARRAGHGLPAPERALVLAAADRRA